VRCPKPRCARAGRARVRAEPAVLARRQCGQPGGPAAERGADVRAGAQGRRLCGGGAAAVPRRRHLAPARAQCAPGPPRPRRLHPAGPAHVRAAAAWCGKRYYTHWRRRCGTLAARPEAAAARARSDVRGREGVPELVRHALRPAAARRRADRGPRAAALAPGHRRRGPLLGRGLGAGGARRQGARPRANHNSSDNDRGCLPTSTAFVVPLSPSGDGLDGRARRGRGAAQPTRGGRAQVVPVFAGGLDFSLPVRKFFYDPLGSGRAYVNAVVSLTGFALVGGPARQDAPKARGPLPRRGLAPSPPAGRPARRPVPGPAPGKAAAGRWRALARGPAGAQR